MEYDLTTEERPEYLYARVRAVAVTRELLPRMLKDIKRSLMDSRQGRLLLEYELAHTLREDDALSLTEEVAKTMPGFRIAFVNRDTKHFSSFFLTAGMGAASGHEHAFFTDLAKARSWLAAECE